MCGLGGYVGTGGKSILASMVRQLRHRGPDASGTWHNREAGLAHTRLSILDLSSTGAQPMEHDDVHITYNGEIYNSPELRHDLESLGLKFRGHSDTEVILQGYRAWGDQVVERLSGMFAFAIWDGKSRRLLLARDRVGIKPLFHAEHAQGLVFASEIKAIFAHDAIIKRLNTPMVDAYLALGYVPVPNTIFAGIQSLPPAHLLVWQAGKTEVRQYWVPPAEPVHECEKDEIRLIDELDARLNNAVNSHLLADVEVGTFLSGGVDSSLVTAIAARQMTKPIKTFTIGFPGGGDERRYARIVADYLGTDHHEQLVELDMVDCLPELVRRLEQPLFDNSIFPTFLVSRMARKKVKAVLGGDGGDEPFFGYEWSRWALSLPHLGLAISWAGWKWAYRRGNVGKALRLCHDIVRSADDSYLRRVTTAKAFRQWIYTPDFQARLACDPVRDLQRALTSIRGSQRFALADLQHYLPEDVLFKVDRMSMANSLEVRVPLLDHRLLEWVLRLPTSLRFREGRGKYLLRKVAARYLPAEILAPRKQGFTIPIGRWLRGPLADYARQVLASQSFASRGMIQPTRALQLLEMHQAGSHELGHRIWSLIMLECWFREWMDT